MAVKTPTAPSQTPAPVLNGDREVKPPPPPPKYLIDGVEVPDGVSQVIYSVVIKDGLPTIFITADVRGIVKIAHRHFLGVSLLVAAQDLMDTIAR